MPNYIEDQDEELIPLDEATDEAPLPVGAPRKWWKPKPAGRLPALDDAAPTPGSLPIDPSIPGATPNAAPSIRNPVVVNRENTENALAAKKNEQPKENNPKWWQRVAAAGVGAAAGYVNAEGKVRHPIDASGAVDTIMGGPQQRQKVAAWQRGVSGAQANVDAAKANEQAWWKNESLQNDEQYKQAQEARLNAQATREAGRNDAEATKSKQADAEKQDQLALKGREDAYLMEQGAKPPEGWDVIQSAANPGRAYAAPPRFAKLPPELVDYAPGRKAGEQVPASEIKAARIAAQKDTLAQNRPAAENVDRILLNPSGYTPDQVKKAQEMFDKMHRPPVNNFTNTDAGKAAMEEAAQSLAKGDLSRLKDISGMRGQERLQLFARARQINPSFNTAELDRKIKMEDYYSNGKGANNLQSFGTFLEHGGAALDAAQAISQTNSRLVNKPINWWRTNMAGDPNFLAFQASLEPVRKEFEGFLLGGRALYGDDRRQAEIILNDNSPLAAVQSALKTMGHTAQARMNEENFRYKKVIGHDLVDPLSPEAIEGARRIGVNIAASPQQNGGGGRGNAGPQANPNPNGYVPGHVYGGLTYLGGDPNNKASWK